MSPGKVVVKSTPAWLSKTVLTAVGIGALGGALEVLSTMDLPPAVLSFVAVVMVALRSATSTPLTMSVQSKHVQVSGSMEPDPEPPTKESPQ